MSLDISQYVDQAVRAVVREATYDPSSFEPLRNFNEHWSPSSLSMARRCPEQFRRRYILGHKERPGSALVIGTAVHKGVERNCGQKIESHIDLPMVDLLDWYDDEGWPWSVNDEQEKTGQEILWKDAPDSARGRGRTMLSAYHHNVAPRIQPIGVEGMVEVDFGLAVPVIGRYDILRESTVIDLKTGQRAQKKPKESWRIQAAVYGEAAGRPVEFHSVTMASDKGAPAIWTPLEAEGLLEQPTEREREHMRISLRAVSAEVCLYMTLFGPEEPWPTHGRFHDWACDWCGFRSTCPAWEE